MAGFAWFRRKEQLPRNARELQAARRRLVRQIRRRDRRFRVIRSRVTRAGGARGVEVVGDQRIARGTFRTRTLHLFKGNGEYVLDMLAPVGRFAGLNRTFFSPAVRSLKVTGKVERKGRACARAARGRDDRRQLAPALEGRTLAHLEVLDPRWCDPAPPEALADAVDGRLIESLGRRGKYLIVSLEGDVHLVMHLRMTGNLLLADPEPPYLRVRFSDAAVRPTGCCSSTCAASERATCCWEATPWPSTSRSRLGVEPLSPDFTAEALQALARGRRAPVKAFLLTQERIAGVGNIYADEALFGARIHPLRPVGRLKRGQIEALREAVIATLEAGIEAKGASIDDFRHTDGVQGSFQDRFLVHNREGEPCPRCGHADQEAAGRGPRVPTSASVASRARGPGG